METEIMELYNNLIGNNYNFEYKNIENNICNCNVGYIKDDNNLYICSKCGVIDIYRANFVDNLDNNIIVRQAYKRVHHFMEQIRNIQGKIGTDLDDDLINLIKLISKNNPENTRKALKHLRRYDLYEKIYYINHIIYNSQLLYIDETTEKKIINLFYSIEREYYKLKLVNRKRFILTNYLLYKILLNLHVYDIANAIKRPSYNHVKYEIYERIKNRLGLEY